MASWPNRLLDAITKPQELLCSPLLRALWPDPLADLWHGLYPELFDADDLRITRKQPNNHFAEWFVAIHLFQTYGVHSLIEKYSFKNHDQKRQVLELLRRDCGSQPAFAECLTRNPQPPDLLVYLPDRSRFGFVEVKGPGDRSRPAQNDHHSDLAAKLGTFVHRVTVKLDDDPLSAYSVFQLVWLTEKMASRVKGDRGRPEILWQPVKSLRGGEGGHGIEFYRAGISHPIAFLDGYEWRDKPDAVATVYILESSASSDALRDAFQAIAYFLRFQRTGPFHGSVKPFPCISIFANA